MVHIVCEGMLRDLALRCLDASLSVGDVQSSLLLLEQIPRADLRVGFTAKKRNLLRLSKHQRGLSKEDEIRIGLASRILRFLADVTDQIPVEKLQQILSR